MPEIRPEAHFGDRVVRCFAPRPPDLHALLAEAAARNPEGEALVQGDARLTYAALESRVARLAGGLAARGIGAGDRVALLLGNRAEFVVALFAAARLGAVFVPLSEREATPGLAYLLAHSGAAVLLHDPAFADRLPPPAETPVLRLRVAVPGPAWDALLDAAPLPPARAGEEDVAALFYSSGTTGRPKGVMLTHLGFVHSAMHYERAMRLGPADRSVVAVPLSHITGTVAQVLALVRAAGTLIVLPQFKAREFLALAARERMTHTLMVPAMYALCLLDPEFARHDLSAWRIGGYGGAPMPEETVRRLAEALPGLGLMNAYGATETTSPATLLAPEDALARRDTVGRAVPCAELRVTDLDGSDLPPGEAGEIRIRGPMVARGYWNDPAATAAAFEAGWWRSGDIGALDAEGFLRVLDRSKDMINRGGLKVYSAEVENALLAHPSVVEAAVVAYPCPVLGERVRAFVVAREPVPEPDELRALCAARLADYKVPERILLRDAPLPRNAAGKVLKRELRMLDETTTEAMP
ncbi:AMP-binding protein [Roseomonas sp. NAR14]|uniref:AMP-binding protein n=1 Tax=Roseomonas acroporae TaxID=2937791 RepID=A0A9X1Y7D4_9PROT|nr:AMP-binding protein [Roseomonas acroporae]MCK8785349.1 AMP-binding protein [Roseomonas acroporae]